MKYRHFVTEYRNSSSLGKKDMYGYKKSHICGFDGTVHVRYIYKF